MPRRPLAAASCAALLLLCLLASPAAAAKKEPTIKRVKYPGMQTLTYRYGPIRLEPGANNIRFNPAPQNLRPRVPGYITRFKPNMVRADGSIPPVDEVHLHHSVWLINFRPTFASGEEKTIIQAPRGFGWRYETDDRWIVNDMLHNLQSSPETVYLTWTIDFVPDTAPAAATIKPVETQWMDVAGISAYPVFDALRRFGGGDGRFTFPQEAAGTPEQQKIGGAREWRVPRDLTLVGTAGHVHPGGLYTDLRVTRNGVTKRLFRSRAKYYDPRGPISWDLSMYATPPGWRIKLRKGDVVSVSAAYDVSRASWYEGMGISPLAVYNGTDAGGVDPFRERFPTRGILTHGRLRENIDRGGSPIGLPDPRSMRPAKAPKQIGIRNFFFERGDLNRRLRPPAIRRGQSLTFRNLDAARDILHSVTACAAPCNRRGSVGYPLANGPVEFDSGNLGFRRPGDVATAASGRDTWSTPSNLPTGTYTYFCRIHPFMRGAFKVTS